MNEIKLQSEYYKALEENLKKYGIPEEAAEKARESIQGPEDALFDLLVFLIT